MTTLGSPERDHFVLGERASDAVRAVARQLEVRPSSVLQAAWGVLVGRHLDRPVIRIDAVGAAGPQPQRVSALRVDGGTFAAAVRAADTPARTEPVPEPGQFSDDDAEAGFRWADDTGRPVPGPRAARDGLIPAAAALLDVRATGSGLECWLEIRTARFGPTTAGQVAAELDTLLVAAAGQPEALCSRLPLLAPAERARLLARDWAAGPAAADATSCTIALFDEQVRRTPDAIAVSGPGPDQEISYAEMQRRSADVARALAAAGAAHEQTVGILLSRGADFVAALLGTLRAGAAFIPLDLSRETAYLGHVVRDAGCVAIVSSARHEPLLRDVLGTCREAAGPAIVDLGGLPGTGGGYPAHARGSACCAQQGLAYLMFTSGSTGIPKGAMVETAGMVNHMTAKLDDLGIGSADVLAQTAPVCFDIVVWQCLAPLLRGARVHVIDDDVTADPRRLVETMAQSGTTIAQLVPAMLRSLVAAMRTGPAGGGRPMPALRWIVPTGDALPEDLCRQWFELCPDVPVLNTYGSTECSDDQCHLVLAGWSEDLPAIISIGRPIRGTTAYVLDDHGAVVPVGVPGELHIGGVGVGRGYLGRPDLTAAKFLPDPFTGTGGGRMYRTGDKVRWRADGTLDFLGRVDLTVKIRGRRIDVDEVERVLRGHDDVHDCVVRAYSHAGEVTDARLAAYVARRPGATVTAAALRLYLDDRLPEYMRPAAFTFLDALPLSANGKVDRKALPDPGERGLIGDEESEAPATEPEARMAALWASCLGLSQVPVDRTFVELGGHSLLAGQLVALIEQQLGAVVTLPDLFAYPTVRLMAKFVEMSSPGPHGRRSSPYELRLAPREAYEPFELTSLQQAYWVGRTTAFELGGVNAHAYLAADCAGLDLDRALTALRRLVALHDALRLVIGADGAQRILPHAEANVAVEDLRGRPAGEISQATRAVGDRMAAVGPDPAQAPQLEIVVHVLDGGRHRVHLSLGLLAADGRTEHVLLRDWLALYRDPGRSPQVPDVSYRDYVRAVLGAQRGPAGADWRYWQERIPDLPPAPELPLTERPPSAARRLTRRIARLDRRRWAAFKSHAGKAGVTPSAALLTAYAEVLSHWSKSPHFTLNVMSSWRLPYLPASDEVTGNLSSTLPVEIDCRGPVSFADRCAAVQGRLLEDLQHGEIDGVRVAREAARAHGWSSRAVFPVVFASVLDVDTSFLARLPFPADVLESALQTPQVYLDHQVYEYGGALVANWDTVDDRFLPGVIQSMFGTFERLLAVLSDERAWARPMSWADPLPRAAEVRQAGSWLSLDQHGLLHTSFFARAAAAPGRPAVISGASEMTYGELAARAAWISEWLTARGAGPGVLVPVVADQGWEQIAAVLGILSSGAAYLPVDAGLPAARIRYLIEQATSAAVLTQSWAAGRIPPGLGREWLPVDEAGVCDGPVPVAARQSPADTAYVIYTSGSTGQPKGVEVSHRGAVNTVSDVRERIGLGPADMIAGISSLSFDLSVFDIFGALSAGAALAIPERERLRDPAHWADLATSAGVTVWNSVPALMELLVDQIEHGDRPAPARLRVAMLSGDWIPVTLPSRIREIWPSCEVISMGGATEASIWSIFYRVGEVPAEWRSIPYGQAMTNQQTYVLDTCQEPRPVLATGEIAIGGSGLARGYWRDKVRTAERFVRHEPSGARLYLTGDQGRVLPDGNIEFLGREDFQVKINGYRVELGEIEAAMRQAPYVRDAAVAVAESAQGGKSLIASVVPADDRLDLGALRGQLAATLPRYMVPASIRSIPAVPLTANGKVDRRALAVPADGPAAAPGQGRRAPAGYTERAVANAFGHVLDRAQVAADDNFFALGGNSFLAVRLVSAISARLHVDIPLSAFFENPTVGELAALARAGGAESGRRSSLVPIAKTGQASPFFCVHPVGGTVMCYRQLAGLLPPARPFYGLEAQGLRPGEQPSAHIEEMASAYLADVRAVQPDGPYLLGGWSMGGLIAFEMARQLEACGAGVARLLVIDSAHPGQDPAREELTDGMLLARMAADLTGQSVLAGAPLDEAAVLALLRRHGVLPAETSAQSWQQLRAVYAANLRAIARYRPGGYAGAVRILAAAEQPPGAEEPQRSWQRAGLDTTVDVIPGNHYTIWRPRQLPRLAAAVARHMTAGPGGDHD